jgi:hypothetical protein
VRDDEIAAHVAERLAAIPTVEAVALGGSRATGTHHSGSDWDFGLYYRGVLDTDAIRALGWEGTVFEPGAWGGGVFNGGAWLHVDGRKVDIVYRDLNDVERRCQEAKEGIYHVERLMFYVAGVPTYVVVGELALNDVLVGDLPRPEYPTALAESASRHWHQDALMTVDYARRSFAERGDVVGTAAHLGRAILEEAHSRCAQRRQWVLNEKGLAERAGLQGLHRVLGELGTTAADLTHTVDRIERELTGQQAQRAP